MRLVLVVLCATVFGSWSTIARAAYLALAHSSKARLRVPRRMVERGCVALEQANIPRREGVVESLQTSRCVAAPRKRSVIWLTRVQFPAPVSGWLRGEVDAICLVSPPPCYERQAVPCRMVLRFETASRSTSCEKVLIAPPTLCGRPSLGQRRSLQSGSLRKVCVWLLECPLVPYVTASPRRSSWRVRHTRGS